MTHATYPGFEAYMDSLCEVIGHADRKRPLRDYCTGLLLPVERKSVEPMAALTAPARVAAQHQSLLHFVANAPWSDAALMRRVRELVLPRIEALGPIEAWIVDDTGFPKKGRHSVGVAHQYCGERGKQENCQVIVTLSLANRHASLPVAHRLYLPQAWASDPERRRKAKIPREVIFQTKPQIALQQISENLAAGIARGSVLADAGYGNDGAFRAGITALGLEYVVGVQSNLLLWRPEAILPLTPRGRRKKPSWADQRPSQASAKELALAQPDETWREITWRVDGDAFRSRFLRLRVRPATRDTTPAEEWLLVEWPAGEAEPTKYWLSTLSADIAFEALVDRAKLRWRIERDYLELKQELGLGHYEGRGWRGLHHHVSLSIAAYGFLIAERAAFPPDGHARRTKPQAIALPLYRRPTQTSDPTGTAHAAFNRDNAPADGRRNRGAPLAMSLLPPALHAEWRETNVTQ